MQDSRANLAFDVVADQGKSALFEAATPDRIGCNENGNAINVGASGFQRARRIPLARLLRPDGKIGNEHVRSGAYKAFGDVDRRLVRFLDIVAQVTTESVQRRTAPDGHSGWLGFGKTLCYWVRRRSLLQRHARPCCADVERGRNLDVSDMIAAQLNIHQAGKWFVGASVGVVRETLHER